MEVKFQVQTKIMKPVSVVFESMVKPKKLESFFVKTSSGPLVEGATVTWTWTNLPNPTPVKVVKIEHEQLIALEWEASGVGYNTHVEIALVPLEGECTMVKISETGWKTDQAGLNSSYEHCEGWQHMTDCLKAYLEHGIDLRGGNYCG